MLVFQKVFLNRRKLFNRSNILLSFLKKIDLPKLPPTFSDNRLELEAMNRKFEIPSVVRKIQETSKNRTNEGIETKSM